MASGIDRKGARRPTGYGRRDHTLQSYPPIERWDDWTEYDPAQWPKRVPREYMLVPTTCFNCESGCGLTAFVDKETLEIRKVEGNPYHPGSRGRNCAKGPATVNQVNDPERILYPQRRTGVRGGGEWERVSWDHVLDTFAERMHDAFAAQRPNDVLYFVGRPGEDGFADRFLETWGCDGHNSHTNVCSSGGEPLRLAPRQVEQKRAAGALLVDVRTDIQFDDAHIRGAVSIPLMRAGFGSKLTWLADRDQELVLIGRDDEDGRHAGRLAVAVGLRKLGGFLHGGMTSWRQEKQPAECIERQTVEQLHQRTEGGEHIQILDVRDDKEWDQGHIPGSVLKTWHDITEVPDGLDCDQPIAVICGSGQRAATGASLIERFGAQRVIHVVDGGVPKWGRLGYPIEHSAAVTTPA